MSFGKKTILTRGQYVVYKEDNKVFVEVVNGHRLGALFLIQSGDFRRIDPKFNLTVLAEPHPSSYKLVQGRNWWSAWHMS